MKYFLTFLLCFVFSFSWAQQDAALQEYARKINTVTTLQSDFSEEKHLSLLDQPLRSSGTLCFDKKAQRLRWQYEKPFERGFLIEGENAYRIQGKERQPLQATLERKFMAEMVVWLTLDFEALQKNYQIARQGTQITFIPFAKEHKVIKQIVVWLHEKDPRIVTQVKMEQPGGDFILWKFSHTQLNPARTCGEGA